MWCICVVCQFMWLIFFYKQKTAYEVRISDWSSDVCSSDLTVRDILADGGDWVEVLGQKKHIQGYLKDFLFEPGLADARIETLSGGEQYRLLLAREIARRSNLKVLDVPTKDQDMDTLDRQKELHADHHGAVLIFSPDRDLSRTRREKGKRV